MKNCNANAMSKDPKKQRNAMLIKSLGALAALIISLINMFISGFTKSKF